MFWTKSSNKRTRTLIGDPGLLLNLTQTWWCQGRFCPFPCTCLCVCRWRCWDCLFTTMFVPSPYTAALGFEPTSAVSRVVPDWDLLKALPTEPQRVQGLVSPDLRSSWLRESRRLLLRVADTSRRRSCRCGRSWRRSRGRPGSTRGTKTGKFRIWVPGKFRWPDRIRFRNSHWSRRMSRNSETKKNYWSWTILYNIMEQNVAK